MPRSLRLYLPGVPLHIIQRGNNKQPCFRKHDDYIFYLQKLKQYSDRNCVAVHSYVLMTNHVHLLLTPTKKHGISKLMHSLGTSYVKYFNTSYGRSGGLWDGRFKALLVATERYLLTLSRYIELNPVRAQMVEKPEQYPWSSYQHNALGMQDDLITQHPIYNSLHTDPQARFEAYRALFDYAIPEESLSLIRQSTNKELVLNDYM
ncbi:MAG: transposase [Pseudohongiellaceae bacterium]|nr:transposase [Pseudohongiellaceae bacterium]